GGRLCAFRDAKSAFKFDGRRAKEQGNMRVRYSFGSVLLATLTSVAAPVPGPSAKPDISNKALITTAPPTVAGALGGADGLRRVAQDYYNWRNENYPVGSSEAGLHTWDDRLT